MIVRQERNILPARWRLLSGNSNRSVMPWWAYDDFNPNTNKYTIYLEVTLHVLIISITRSFCVSPELRLCFTAGIIRLNFIYTHCERRRDPAPHDRSIQSAYRRQPDTPCGRGHDTGWFGNWTCVGTNAAIHKNPRTNLYLFYGLNFKM